MKVYFEQPEMLAFATAMMNKEKRSIRLVGQKPRATALDLQEFISGNMDALSKEIKK
jgi:hypothetical protein